MLLGSVYVSSSCVIAWWLHRHRVKTSCHINRTIYKSVGCNCEYLLMYIGLLCPVNGRNFICWLRNYHLLTKDTAPLSLIDFKRQCFKPLQMFSQYCHFLISLEYAMQESTWNVSLDIMSHCGWVNFIRMFTYPTFCILRSMGTLLVTCHWRMGPQTSSQCTVPVLWGDEQGDTRVHSDKNMEIDSITRAIVYMEEKYYFLRHGHIPTDCQNKVVQSVSLHA